MIVKNGEIIAIDSVKTDNTLSGDGVRQVLGVNTPVVLEPIRNDITNLYNEVNSVSTEVTELHNEVTEIHNEVTEIHNDITNIYETVNNVRDDVDQLSADVGVMGNAILEESEIREEVDNFLSAAIDSKSTNLYPGDNISIKNDIVSVSGTKEIQLHYPMFGIETVSGLVVGVYDTTKQFNYTVSATDVANPLSGVRVSTDGYRIKNNQLMVEERIRNFNLNVSYTPDGQWHPDFLYETAMLVMDKDNNVIYTDYQSMGNKHSNSFSLSLNNNAPYTFTLSGDTDKLSGVIFNISCLGTYMPNYEYLDEREVEASTGNQILVWNPHVLGTGNPDEVVGVEDNTGLGV